ncbi:DUF1033 family protein [Listeria costaricensis]|uniref:DUF1033 family protein n=1 Tax=Listeria costaricensis TaxID=2026604 RepID=UPI000C07CC7F|nr:DUF1033 family protein [Listeria costaricensis]
MEYQVLITKGEFEPWWFFEEWEETITETFTYIEKEAAFEKYQEICQKFQKSYPEMQVKKTVLAAFWDEAEIEYCEDCEDDIQTFHGVLLLADGNVYEPDAAEKEKWFTLVGEPEGGEA